MKIFLGIIFFIFAISFNLFGASFWGEGFSFSGGYIKTTALKTNAEGTFSVCKILDDDFIADGGLSINDSSINVAGGVLLMPFQTNLFSFGIKNILNYSNYFKNSAFETDFICMGLFSLKNSNISNPLVFSIGYGFDYKRTTIESKRSKNIKLENIGHAITLDVRKRFLQKHEIYARLSSFDDYYFPEFFTPYYTVGYSLDISKKITLGAVGSVRYTDQFTLNGVLEGFQARIFASYKW